MPPGRYQFGSHIWLVLVDVARETSSIWFGGMKLLDTIRGNDFRRRERQQGHEQELRASAVGVILCGTSPPPVSAPEFYTHQCKPRPIMLKDLKPSSMTPHVH